MKSLVILAVMVWAVLLQSRNAYAYIDPGTGSYMLQIIIAGIVGATVSAKIFFHRIRAALGSVFGGSRKDSSAQEDE